MFAITLEAFRIMWRPPYPWRDFIRQSWFIASVAMVPAMLVSIAFGATIALQVGNVARQLGAESQTGAAMVLAVVREAAPIVAALLILGAGGRRCEPTSEAARSATRSTLWKCSQSTP
jgi:phospholipid/cholesterol/gamma-HCH transport system permease protein